MSNFKKMSLFATPQFMADAYAAQEAVDTEIGFFGIPHKNDPLTLVAIRIPPQECTAATVKLRENEAAAWMELVTEQLEKCGYADPTIFERYWIHTHPGPSCEPSTTDLTDFETRQGLGFDYLAHLIIGSTGKWWGRFDCKIAGTNEYIEKELDLEEVMVPPSPWVKEAAIQMAQKKTYGHTYKPSGGYNGSHHGGYCGYTGKPNTAGYKPKESKDEDTKEIIIPKELRDEPLKEISAKTVEPIETVEDLEAYYDFSALTLKEKDLWLKVYGQLQRNGFHSVSDADWEEYQRLEEKVMINYASPAVKEALEMVDYYD